MMRETSNILIAIMIILGVIVIFIVCINMINSQISRLRCIDSNKTYIRTSVEGFPIEYCGNLNDVVSMIREVKQMQYEQNYYSLNNYTIQNATPVDLYYNLSDPNQIFWKETK